MTPMRTASASAGGRPVGVARRPGRGLLAQAPDAPGFFAGCSEEQVELPFNLRVLLTAPRPVPVGRLRARSGNPYGGDSASFPRYSRTSLSKAAAPSAPV